MPTKNHFAVLGIDIGADESQVKKAYRTLAKQWHPDKNKDAGAKEKFQEIAASYEYLSSTDRREMLERELRRAAAAPPAAPPRANPPPPQQQQQQQTQNNKSPFGGFNTSNANSSSQKTTGPSSTKSSSTSSKPRNNGSAKSKQRKTHWSDSFTKNYGKGHGKEDGSTASGKQSEKGSGKPSFGYRSYVSTPSEDEDEDIYQGLFGDFFYSAMGFGGLSGGLDSGLYAQGKPKPGRPRNVAHETGFAEGLDDEYMFTPRRENEDSTEKLPCPWCGNLFTRGKLGQHEEKCGKFGLSAEEDEDDDAYEADDFFDSDDADDGFSYYSNSSSVRPPPGYARRPSWQQKHEETRSKIRRDKMRHRDRVASQGTRNAGYVTCPYCLRDFSSHAAAKHMPWCKEHTARFGRPLNPKPYMAPGASPSNKGDGDKGGGLRGAGRGRGAATSADTRPGAASTRRDSTRAHDAAGDFYGYGREEEDKPRRTGNDQPFPTHGPKIPDMFDIRGTSMGRPGPGKGPKVTIGLGRGSKIYVGISTDRSSHPSGNPSGPSANFTAQAGRRSNGAFNVRFNLNANVGGKSKPGSYASAFQNKR